MEYSFFEVAAFFALIIAALLVDLFAHRQDKDISAASAIKWSIFWIILSLAFAVYVSVTHGPEDSFAFLSGYVLEKTLSIDNLFVIMAIFVAFSIEDKFQHRILYYGILGALIMRLIFIAVGTTLIDQFGGAALTIFGVFIIWSAFKMMQAAGIGYLIWSLFKKDILPPAKQEEGVDYQNHWSIKLFRHFFPVTPKRQGHNFFIGRAATPLFLCLLTVEFADIMFAFDSVPAVIAITQKPFLIYTSNVFAILGMRSLYFCLAAAKRALVHLEKAVIATLFFIGFKMLAEVFFGLHISAGKSLCVVMSLLAIGVIASFIWPAKKEK